MIAIAALAALLTANAALADKAVDKAAEAHAAKNAPSVTPHDETAPDSTEYENYSTKRSVRRLRRTLHGLTLSREPEQSDPR